MKTLLLFFLSAATTYADLGLTNSDGDLLPSGTGQAIEETTNLSVPMLAEAKGSARMPVRVGTLGEARESTRLNSRQQLDSRGAQTLLLTDRERGDAPLLGQLTIPRSSAASNVQPADAACPQSIASPVALSKQEKLSPAEMYARLDIPRQFSIEQQVIDSLRFRK